MQLVERGSIALDDDVRSLVPELGELQILRGFDAEDKPILEDTDKPITLRHVLRVSEVYANLCLTKSILACFSPIPSASAATWPTPI